MAEHAAQDGELSSIRRMHCSNCGTSRPSDVYGQNGIPDMSCEIGRQSASEEHAAGATPTPVGSEPLEPGEASAEARLKGSGYLMEPLSLIGGSQSE